MQKNSEITSIALQNLYPPLSVPSYKYYSDAIASDCFLKNQREKILNIWKLPLQRNSPQTIPGSYIILTLKEISVSFNLSFLSPLIYSFLLQELNTSNIVT